MSRPTLTGTTIGTYRILSLLGAGGMGEVYTARIDSSSATSPSRSCPKRSHTINCASIGSGEKRSSLAALNHPNIATIHRLVEADGALYLVMELVPGQTLAERLHSGRKPLDETLRVCRQLAEALNARHGPRSRAIPTTLAHDRP